MNDLRFLYEFDSKIEGFGYQEDQDKDKEGRDTKEDLSSITGFSKDEVSITKEEALSGDIKYHYGDQSLSGLTSAEDLKLPQSIGGNLWLNNLTSPEGLKLSPEHRRRS